MKKSVLITIALFFTLGLNAQNKSQLKLTDIMQGQKFTGYWPDNIYWAYDSKTIYFEWNPEQEILMQWYGYSLDKKSFHKLSEKELQNRLPKNYKYNADKSKMIYTRNGDLYVFDVASKSEKQLTNTIGFESEPEFSSDGKKIFYQLEKNMFEWNTQNNLITQLTNFQIKETKKSKSAENEQDKWLIEDRAKLFTVLSENAELSKAKAAQHIGTEVKRPAAIYTGSSMVWGMEISPDERFITYVKMIRANAIRTEVPDYVTKSGYVKSEKARSKVGSEQSTFEFWIFDRQENKAYPLNTSTIDGITEWPEPYTGKVDGERKLTIGALKYSNDGKKAALVVRSQDNKDLWFLQIDLVSGNPTVLNRQTDKAWIGGPGIGSYWPNSNFGWMPDNENLYFQWEKTGYSHLYTVNSKSKKTKALTKGKFEVYEAYLSKDKTKWYLLTNEVHPGERQFYSMPIKGGDMTRITKAEGYNNVILSPDEKQMAIRYSSSTEPWELFIKTNDASASAVKITQSQSEAFKAYSWHKPEVITFKAADGEKVYARLYQPKSEVKNKAAVVFVHGAGYLQNAHKYWSNYYREMMFHNLLIDNGYTVLDIDYRGSSGYGRDWRTGIYQHMGGKDLSDQVDGAKFLVDNYDIDAKRIGMYGGSYGGFITLMAMFNTPDVFKCGAALRSVTNWSNYNHGYTVNILNTPVVDPEAYRRSSPIYFAEGLKGHLLILHGMKDDNVHFQDVVDLNQRLIELGKSNWEMALFPLERHSFKHPTSWTDEYRRIFELFEKQLK